MVRVPEFMVRVKLPDAAAYHSSPSGDTAYEDAYQTAIAKAMPPGFEVVPLKSNEQYPTDRAGRSCVLIRPVAKDEDMLWFYIEQIKSMQLKLEAVKKIVN